ncbi:gamma-glutamyltransferase family protein [Imbroritus primus]|uniref:Gamma-glutamyltransferase family protein n=1 Tax=Imbroritus primus TaxID=3058603 RepID=A0ACD3SKC3_9BURK|nr:gamma-glutamyltransferase family protein [Burkholderiaceae bacterium PBA]
MQPSSSAWRPTIAGSHYAVSTGHYLATAAATRALELGGNAIDAGVTAAMVLAVVQPDVVSFAGVAPTLVYLREEQCVVSLEGLGYWPALTDIARLREVASGTGGTSVPEGILRQIVPAAPATHIEALRRFGTFSFEQAALPAMELAEEGFYVYPELSSSIALHAGEFARYAENATTFLPGGQAPGVGARLRQPNLARTIGRMIASERAASGNRAAKLRAVHEFFYRGDIAREIDAFHRQHGGFLRYEDLAGFEVPVAQSIATQYHGHEVHACDTWCQGVVLLETLKILERDDLRALGHNSPAYLHLLAEALNLSFADREAYVGDPSFIDVPTAELLSARYAADQRARIDAQRAFGAMPQPGPLRDNSRAGLRLPQPAQGPAPLAPDTIYGCVVDRQGNAFSVTPSDTTYDSPMVDGLGFVVSTRGMQGRLEDDHPCVVEPGKRPRLTPTPALALRDGEFAMAWGTPGGDVQCASMLQVFLNVTQFGMEMQSAIEAPRVATFNFPNSFAPNQYLPGRLCVESSVGADTIDALSALGHDVQVWPERSWSAGAVCAIARDPATQMLHAGADPRRAAYAMAR